MKKVAELLNKMIDNGVISDYAIFGAVAQMRYTEAVSTMDADVLIALPADDEFVILTPIYSFCEKLGYLAEGDAIRVGEWPVQFIPAFDLLTKDAMHAAETTEIDNVMIRVVRADYLATIALFVGRTKDYLRIISLLDVNAVTENEISILAEKYGFLDLWLDFNKRFLSEK
jgi:hypothetical protein